jgi:hypothetical protein
LQFDDEITPCIVNEEGDLRVCTMDLTEEEANENAELIVRAVNSYDAMREALEQTMRALRWTRDNMPAWDAVINPELMTAWDKAKAALAFADGKVGEK